MKIWEGYRKGINLGGWFSQCNHEKAHYDTFIKDEDFRVIASWGLDHVRVPVDYELLETEDGSAWEDGYERLQKVVRLCRENGLHMILDLHKTAGYSFDANEGEAGFFENEALQERFYALWETIAKHFGKDADMLAFELLNEITKKAYGPAWNRIAKECIRRIRAIAPDTWILVGGYEYNSAVAVKDIDVPDDGHIVYNFHCYEPLIFTHQGAYWHPMMDRAYRLSVRAPFEKMAQDAVRMGSQSNAGFEKYPADTTLSAAYFIDFMAEAAACAEKKNVPLYCGEYGVIDCASPEDALEWFRMIHEAFEHYGIGRAAWSYRQMDFGLSDPRMDDVRAELLLNL
ncbi:MAG: cellulase family glycosylhydrolase [Lachnospiraceae bacterium]|nr:cellulase family glycosylhydrolase [Lachnospiraceae bacterium]